MWLTKYERFEKVIPPLNNSPETAPSKRLEKLIPNYAKIKNGTLISKDMGIDKILAECPHFREWIEQISRLGA